MHLIPTKKEEWQNLVPALFKAYIVTAYIIWKLSSLYISGEGSPFMPPFGVIAGYILSIVVLSFVAGVQKGRKQNEAALRTLVFIVIGVVFLSIGFQAGSILTQTAFLADVLMNGLVLCFALNTRRFQKMRALTFWIWGCAINLIRELGLLIFNYWSQQSGNYENSVFHKSFWGLLYNFPTGSFAEFYWLGSLLTGVLYVAGVILAIQNLRAKDQFSPSPNTAMFVALGFLASMILMAISLARFESTGLLPTIAVNAVLLYFCLGGYRQFKSKAFICLVSAAILTIARTIGIEGLNRYHNWLHDGTIYTFEQWIVGLLQIGSILAIILLGVGIIFVVQSISSKSGQPEIV